MKQFVIYPELMGSDQYLPLDGRYGLKRCIDTAIEIGKKKLKKPTKFEIHYGNLRYSRVEYKGGISYD